MKQLYTALERSLPIVASAYAEQFGVNIVLSGNDARTDGQTIYLPLLKADSDLKDVLFGYLAHEAEHVRDSDFGTIAKCKNQMEKSVTNILEDIRIEQSIQAIFPGTRFTLTATWNYIVEQGMSPPAMPGDNEATQLHQYLLHRLRWEELNREASKPLAESSDSVVRQTFPEGFFVRLDGLFGKYLHTLSKSDDCLKLARAILKALKDAEEEEKAKQDQPDSTTDTDTPSGDSGAQDQSGHSADQDTSQGDSPGDSPGDPPQQQSQQDSGNNGAGDQSVYEKLLSESDVPDDVINQLAEKLADQAQADNGGDPITIKASSVGSDAGNDGDSESIKDGIQFSSVLRARLLGLLNAQTREKHWLHTRGKRVDCRRLTRLSIGDNRIFLKKDEIHKPDTSVHLLLDCSGSMRASQDIANQAAVSLALAVSSIPRCDIATSVFPGAGGDVSPVIHRGQPVRANLGRFVVKSHGGTPLAEAMMYASRDLSASTKQRKVLIIVTDGQPNNGAAVQYMTNLIAGYIDTYAIGINSTSVSHYFDNWSVIENVKELQSALFDIARQFLDLR